MSFLAPLFLLGALAVALPVIFHLIRRTSREKLPFSSLMFLQPTPPRLTRRSRLEHILLLLLRCLALCLLAFGFARPFLQRPAAADPQSGAGKKVVLLVDTSASMRRENLWPSAVARAEEVLGATSPADQVAVFTFDREVRSLVSFEQWSSFSLSERVALTAQRLKDVEPGWAGTHLGNAIVTAVEILLDADKQNQSGGARRIVVVTDLQEGSRLDGLQGFDWPRGVEVVIEPLKPAHPSNAGLQWVLDLSDTLQADSGLRVRVSNAADARREQFQIRWSGIAGAGPLDVYVPPGQSRIVQAPKLPDGASGERLVLTGDDEAFDNTVHLVQSKPEQVNVLFAGADAENNPAQLLYYLKRAFQPTRRYSVQIVARDAKTPVSEKDLQEARLIIVSDRMSEDRLQGVERFLAQGGVVLLTMKTAGAAATLGRLVGDASVAATEAGSGGYSMFGSIDFEHPLFAPFADPRYSDFTKIHFWKHRRVEVDRIDGARVPAKFDNGEALLVDIPRGKGTLLVLTAGWHPEDSQLALSSKFVPLLHSILELAGGIRTPPTQYEVGDEVNLAGVAGAAGAGAPAIRKPDGASVSLSSGATRFLEADQPGVYTVESAQPPVRFGVNLAAAESRTAPLPIEDLQRLGIPMKAEEISLKKQAEQKRRLQNAELENQQKLWRWLIVAALVVLMVETWLAGWLTNRTGTQTEVTT